MSPDGKERYEHTERGNNPVELGEKVTEVLNAQGVRNNKSTKRRTIIVRGENNETSYSYDTNF